MNDRKTALVIGASGYFGRAIARRLAEDGCQLGLHAWHHPERLPVLPQAHSYTADLRCLDQIQTLAAGYLKDAGRLDVLVWAAGTTHEAPVASMSEDDLRKVLQLDLTAPFLVAKTFSRQFLKQKSGCVVILSSHAAVRGRTGGGAYAMAHSGLLALVRSLAREWGPLGIRVNAVLPPFSPDGGFGGKASPEFIERVKRQNVYAADAVLDQTVSRFVSNVIANPSISGQVLAADARISI